MAETDGTNEAGGIEEATSRISELEAELEASSDTVTASEALARSRDILHHWVDSVTAVVATPGVGRVVLIHDDGRESRISSSDLPHKLAPPVSFERRD